MLYDPFPWSSPTHGGVPTTTHGYFRSINPTHTLALISTLNNAYSQLATEKDGNSLYLLSQKIRGAEASLTVIANQIFLANATATKEATAATAHTSTASTQSSKTESETASVAYPTVEADVLSQIAATNVEEAQRAIFNASINLKDLAWEENNYGMYLNDGANIFFIVIFIIIFLGHLVLMYPLKYWYFSIAVLIGCGLEFAGYIGRVLSVNNYNDDDTFLLQFICLTLAPAFIAGGIYYLIGYLCLIYGPQFSPLRPTWYSYIFITCDVLSLVIQALGGGIAASSLTGNSSSESGTHIMVAGIAFQVVSMSLFIILYMLFLHKVHFGFKDRPYEPTVKNWLVIVFLNRKVPELDHLWDPNTSHIRRRKWFKYNQFAILVSIFFVYIRCVYRVVELAEGWSGYLITHEEFVLTLDGMMILLASATLLVLHPYILFGKNLLVLFDMKRKRKGSGDAEDGNEMDDLKHSPELELKKENSNGVNDSISELEREIFENPSEVWQGAQTERVPSTL